MATNIGNLDIGLLVGFLGGVGAFLRGFRTYGEYLFPPDTPEMPICSLPRGLVHIHGKAKSGQLITSPISHTLCCFYKVDVEKWNDHDQSGAWSHYGSRAGGFRFYLEDNSGRTLVDAHNAEFHLETPFEREVESETASTVTACGASDAELLSYVVRVGPGKGALEPDPRPGLERAALPIAKFCAHPTMPQRPFQRLAAPPAVPAPQELLAEERQPDPLSEKVRLAQIDLYSHPFWALDFAEGRKRIIGLWGPPGKQDELSPGPALKSVLPVQDVAPPAASPPLASGRYRFTECCILPDHDYEITGTCTENPQAEDGDDRNLIMKGTNEPTYLISDLAQSDVSALLQGQTQWMIFGGAALSVFCLALLLARFGLF